MAERLGTGPAETAFRRIEADHGLLRPVGVSSSVLRELRQAHAGTAFAQAVLGHFVARGWYTELEFDHFIDLAEQCGLIRTEEYDPATHGHGPPGDEDPDLQPGDPYHVLTEAGCALRDLIAHA